MTASYPALETARLMLQPTSLADAPAMQQIFPQWEIVRYLDAHVPWPYPADGAETFLSEVLLPAIERGGQWAWSIFPRAAPDRLIGHISLRESEDENRGFWMDPAFQGRGLMGEAADAVTGYWFDILGKPVLRVPKAIDNIASVRISQHQGMRCVAAMERDYVGGRMMSHIWEIDAATWRARRAPGPDGA